MKMKNIIIKLAYDCCFLIIIIVSPKKNPLSDGHCLQIRVCKIIFWQSNTLNASLQSLIALSLAVHSDINTLRRKQNQNAINFSIVLH